MGFTSGAISFRRYYMVGRIPKDVTEAFLSALQQHAFGRLGVSDDYTQIGWIGAGHLFQSDIQAAEIAFGRYVHIAMRLDRYAAPASLVRSYIRQEEETTLQATGRAYLSKGECRQAREVAKARAEQEARAGSFRRISAFPLLIDLEERSVLFGNLGAKANEKLVELFHDTFHARLEAAEPARVAQQLMVAAGRERALENLEQFHLVERPDDADENENRYAERDQNFLGKEFLTWLWSRTSADAPLRLANGDDVSVALARTLRLKCDFGLTGVTTLLNENPAAAAEARAALALGKQPTKAGLVLGGAAGEFAFTLDALSFAISSLILVEETQEKDPRARLESRFERTFDAGRLLDALFGLFLEARTGRNLSRELRQMSDWAAGRARRLDAVSA